MASNYDIGYREALEKGMAACRVLLKKLGDAKADSAEWKEQHENLLAMYRAEVEKRVAAEQSLAEQRKDAERYRWLRAATEEKLIKHDCYFDSGEGALFLNQLGDLDAAIDAAIGSPVPVTREFSSTDKRSGEQTPCSPSAEPCERKLGNSTSK